MNYTTNIMHESKYIENGLALFMASRSGKESIILRENLFYDILINSIQICEIEKLYGSKPGINGKILVIDDDVSNRQVLINYLREENFFVTTMKDGFEALDLINKISFDLILIKIKMPHISGYEVCQNIRKIHGLYNLPVIMLTTKETVSDIPAGFSSGANDYITEPFGKEELLSRINTLISLKKALVEIKKLNIKIETIFENIPEGILLLNPGLQPLHINIRFMELFGVARDITNINIIEFLDQEIYNMIYYYNLKKYDKLIFEWIIGSPVKPVLISVILKSLTNEDILVIISEIKNVLTEKELETCYYIIRGYSERETAKYLYKARTTVNSNKVRAREKLRQNGYLSMIKSLE